MGELLYPGRLTRLQKYLRYRKLSAFLVTHPSNRRYLSGYTAADHGIQETSGVLLVPARGLPFLLTDSRFFLQAEQEASGFEVQLYAGGLIATLKKLLPDLGVKRLGFESHYFLHSSAKKLRTMAASIGVDLVPITGVVERYREIKSESEIALVKQAVLLNEEVFQQVYKQIRPGASEVEVSIQIENLMRRMGAERPSFETIVAFGTNAARPHAVPGDRKLSAGETVLVDMGLVLEGYCSDMTRTFVVGKPDRRFVERLQIVRQAQQAGMEAIRAGVTCREVDMAARSVIREAGLGDFFGHALGHGVGLDVHEEPRLSSFSRKKLRAGMVVTVEPGVYLPDWGGIRLENMVVVRDRGCELLNEDTTFLDVKEE